MDLLDFQIRLERVMSKQDERIRLDMQDSRIWLNMLEREVRELKDSFSPENPCAEDIFDSVGYILADVTMFAESSKTDVCYCARRFLAREEDTGYVCGLCPGGVPLLRGSKTDYYRPACKCIYPEDAMEDYKEVQTVTKEEIEKRIIELKNLKSITMTAPGRQAVEDAIRRLGKRLKGKEV